MNKIVLKINRDVCFKRVGLFGLLLVGLLSIDAAAETCTIPVIETSTGEDMVYPGVSTVTITAAPDELISYTTDGTAPSTDTSAAVPGPVTVDVIESEFTIKACAVSETKDPSSCVSKDLYTFASTIKRYDYYNLLFKSKSGGLMSGPLMVYDIKQLKNNSSKYWMVLTNPGVAEFRTSIIVELSAPISEGIKVGETIDYIHISEYDRMDTPAAGGMKRVTKYRLPKKSNPCATGFPQIEQIDGTTTLDQDFWIDHWRVPVEIYNAEIEGGNMFQEQLVTEKFADVTLTFEEGVKYNLRGFAGTDVSDNHQAMRFFVLSYEPASQPTPSYGSISEAFNFEESSHTAVLACDLTVITLNRTRTHLFAMDAKGDCVVITGDFSDSDLLPGEIIRDFTATLTKDSGICYAQVSDKIEFVRTAEEAEPLDIEVADLVDHPGKYVRFESVIERVENLLSRSTALPEIRVGGVKINPSAISDGTAEMIGYAVNEYAADEPFEFRGMLMPDGEGGNEFWPIEILEANGNHPTTGISEAVCDKCQVQFRDGRPVLTSDQEMHDILGRPADPATAPAGFYIVTTSAGPVKLIIP